MLQESASQAAEKESTQAAGSKQLTPQAAKKGSTQATGSKQSTRQAAEKGSTLATGTTPAKKRKQATVSSESPRKKPRLYQKTVDADSILQDGSKVRMYEPKMQHETVERKKSMTNLGGVVGPKEHNRSLSLYIYMYPHTYTQTYFIAHISSFYSP